tara:strand:- start:1637 stop:1990 length:354 start_codon:yes stop_codon:yes gene_type:complete
MNYSEEVRLANMTEMEHIVEFLEDKNITFFYDEVSLELHGIEKAEVNIADAEKMLNFMTDNLNLSLDFDRENVQTIYLFEDTIQVAIEKKINKFDRSYGRVYLPIKSLVKLAIKEEA